MREARNRWLNLLAAAAVTAVLAASCGPPTESSRSTSNSGTTQITVAVPQKGVLPSSVPYAVALARGFFKQHGVDVKVTWTSGGGNTVQTVIGGQIDVAVETGPSAIFSAYEHGAPLKIVASTMTGLDMVFFAKASSSYRTLADLSGQKVGFSEPGSSSNVALEQINAQLKKMSLAPATPEAIGSPPDQLTAVQTGQVAAGFTAPPLFLDKVAAGQLRLVVRGSQFSAYRNVSERVAFTNNQFAEQHANALRGFLAAWGQAWDWAFAHKAEAAKIYKSTLGLNQDLASLQQSFDYYTPQMVRLAPIQGMDQVAKDALDFKLVPKAMTSQDLSKLVDTSFAPKGS